MGSSHFSSDFSGTSLNMYSDGEVELFLGFFVLGLAGDEPVDLFHVGMGEPEHGVDHPHVLRKCHV